MSARSGYSAPAGFASARAIGRERRRNEALSMSRETYLDWNATAPLRPEAAAAISAALIECGNASSVHRWGRAARQRVEQVREAVGALVGATPDSVVFVSGGRAANHLALVGSRRRRVPGLGSEDPS